MAQQHSEGRAMAVPQGATLFRPGDTCPGFVIVHSGTVKVSLTAGNGREIVLYRVRPGDVCLQTFGCLVKGGHYSAEGVAETDLAVEIVPVGEFRRRVAEDEGFRTRLFTAVAARFADLEQLVEDVALSSISARLARALLRLADGEGVVHATHEALAIEIGSAREVVSRQLGVLMREGLIASTRGHIALLHPEGLRALAGERTPV